jgi:hypothetical protein
MYRAQAVAVVARALSWALLRAEWQRRLLLAGSLQNSYPPRPL